MTDYRHRRNHNVPGHANELTFSCYQGYRFWQKERVCQWLTKLIDEARANWHFHLWAYVFMPEHVHLIIHPERAGYDIADIKQAIKGPVGRKAIRYLSEEAPEWIPRPTRKRGKKTERLFRLSVLAIGRRIRPEHRRTEDIAENDRLHPWEPGSKKIRRKTARMEMVERGLVFEGWRVTGCS